MKTLARPAIGRSSVRRLRRSPDSVRRWGRMSAHQMVCHLSGRVPDGDRRQGGQRCDQPVSAHGREMDCALCAAPGRRDLTRPEIEQGSWRHLPRRLRRRRGRSRASDRHVRPRRARGPVSAPPNLRSPEREGMAPLGIPSRRSPPSSVRRIAAHHAGVHLRVTLCRNCSTIEHPSVPASCDFHGLPMASRLL